jgi:anti-anti-sigma factor
LRLFLTTKETLVPDSHDLTERPFEVTTRRDGDSMLIVLSGELDMTGTDRLEAAIRRAEESDINRVIVDLTAITFVDSTGLSVLLEAKRRSDGRLSVTPSQHEAVTRLLELTGTTEILGS